jgi:hypothetical protein
MSFGTRMSAVLLNSAFSEPVLRTGPLGCVLADLVFCLAIFKRLFKPAALLACATVLIASTARECPLHECFP